MVLIIMSVQKLHFNDYETAKTPKWCDESHELSPRIMSIECEAIEFHGLIFTITYSFRRVILPCFYYCFPNQP